MLCSIKQMMMVLYKMKCRIVVWVVAFIVGPLSHSEAFSQNITLPPMPHPRVGMCSARLGSKLYLIGGAQKVHGEGLSSIMPSITGTSIVEVFDFDSLTWYKVAQMNTPRAYATAVALDDSIYVMGGVDDSGRVLNTVEVYDRTKNEWHYTSNMIRYREGAASVAYGDSIFVFGGIGRKGNFENSVEFYSPATGLWSKDSNATLLARAFHRVAKIGTSVYILGGLSSLGPVPWVEKYVPGTGVVKIKFTWRYPRAYFDVVEKNDSIFAISGYGQPPPSAIYAGCYQDMELLNFQPNDDDTEIEAQPGPIMPRLGFVAQLANDGTIYLFGGLSPDDFVNGPVPTVGEVSIPTAIVETSNSVPVYFSLAQNYPNPFNPSTVISYQLSVVSSVTLEIFDILGREVAVLVNERQNPGSYEVKFDGSKFASGLYFYRLSAGRFTQTRKMILTK